jgi:asparagine synthase (glutamine-hydrolysing)
MLDERVVEFSARLPPDLKLRGRGSDTSSSRRCATSAGRDPRQAKHGFRPSGPGRRPRAPAGLCVRQPGLAQGRGIVRPDFLDRLKGDLQVHPGYYGTIIWVLMMLEQWFQHHLPQGRTSS